MSPLLVSDDGCAAGGREAGPRSWPVPHTPLPPVGSAACLCVCVWGGGGGGGGGGRVVIQRPHCVVLTIVSAEEGSG